MRLAQATSPKSATCRPARVCATAVCLCVWVSFSSCAHYEPAPLMPEETARQIASRTLADEGLRAFLEAYAPDMTIIWPRPSWDLAGLSLAAFYFHPSLEVARAKWTVSKAAIRTAGARPNPSITAGPGYNFSAAGATPWLPFVNLDWPLETAGKRRHRISEAKRLSESARLNIATTAWQVRSLLRSSLIDFVGASRRQVLLGEQISIQEQILTLLQQRQAVGAISTAEVTPARLFLQKLRLDESDTRSSTANARAQLAEAIGVPVAALDGVALTFELSAVPAEADDLTTSDARRRALVGRADILARLSDYAASQAALQLQIAKQYPDLRLGSAYQLDDGQNKWTLGVGVELPVLNRNQGPIAEAKARRAAAAARFEALQASVISEVDRAGAVYRAAEDNLTRAIGVVTVQQQQLEAVETQHDAGAADQLELLSAKLEVAASEIALVAGRVRVQRAIGAMEDALQRPLGSDQIARAVRTGVESTEHAPYRSEE